MSYRNDSELVIANKYGSASKEAKAVMFETYDKLRDITVSGNSVGGSGFGGLGGKFLREVARLISPGSFMPYLGSEYMNVPGTSFSTPVSGGNGVTPAGRASFGINNLGTFPAFPSGNAAGIDNIFEGGFTGEAAGIMNDGLTGFAASSVGYNNPSSNANINRGLAFGTSMVLPAAGIISGIGGLVTALAPYSGSLGLLSAIGGNIMQGTGSALAAGISHVSQRVVNNADTTLSNKVRNIETVVKMLDTQSSVARKMLKEGIEGDKKTVDNM